MCTEKVLFQSLPQGEMAVVYSQALMSVTSWNFVKRKPNCGESTIHTLK